jgi:hypothetical protein
MEQVSIEPFPTRDTASLGSISYALSAQYNFADIDRFFARVYGGNDTIDNQTS